MVSGKKSVKRGISLFTPNSNSCTINILSLTDFR